MSQEKPTHLSAEVSESEGQVCIDLIGRLEEAAPGALGTLLQRLPADSRPVVIDLSEVPRFTGKGIVVLTTLVGALQEAGRDVRLRVPDPSQRRALTAYGREVGEPDPPQEAEASDLVERLGERTIAIREAFLRFTLLFQRSLGHAAALPFRRRRRRADLTLAAVLRMGVGATPLVALIAFLIGSILALQGGDLLKTYGQTLLIADLVGLSVTKEIAPLLTAVLVAGRSGSSLAAEIGTMRVSEEVDALQVMGVDPIEYLVAPRVLAMGAVLPALTMIADVVAIAGGLFIASVVYDVTPGAYIDQTIKRVALGDVFGGLMKAFCFGLVIVTIAAYQGFATAGGAAGVGRYTTKSVVQAIIWIIVVDAVFTTGLTLL